MCVGAADPERRHAHPPRMAVAGPGGVLREELDIPRRPIHFRRRFIHMQRRGQLPVPHRHHHLDHTSDTRRRLRMTNIRLHRPQPQRPIAIPPLPVSGNQSLRLNRITKPGSSPMRLHGVHIRHRQTSTRQRLRDHPLLRGPIRRRQTIRRTILIHRATPHDRQNRVPVAPGIRQPLQQHRPRLLPNRCHPQPPQTTCTAHPPPSPVDAKTPRTSPAWPSPSHHPQEPDHTHQTAVLDPPGAAPPTTTNTPYPPSPQDPRNQTNTQPDPKTRLPRCHYLDNPRNPPAPS